MPHTHATGAELAAAAGPRRDLQHDRAPRRWHVDPRSFDRLSERDRQRHLERIAIAMKHRVWLDAHFEKQIARRTATCAREALTAKPHPRTVGEPLRDRHANRFGLTAPPINLHVGLTAVDRERERNRHPRRDVFARRLGRAASSAARCPGTRPATAAATEQLLEPSGPAE